MTYDYMTCKTFYSYTYQIPAVIVSVIMSLITGQVTCRAIKIKRVYIGDCMYERFGAWVFVVPSGT